MAVVVSFSKVGVFIEKDPSTRQQHHYNNVVFKSFHFDFIFDRFHVDARWKRKEKFSVTMKTIWKHIRVDRATVFPSSDLFCNLRSKMYESTPAKILLVLLPRNGSWKTVNKVDNRSTPPLADFAPRSSCIILLDMSRVALLSIKIRNFTNQLLLFWDDMLSGIRTKSPWTNPPRTKSP